jgi:hypothetical protein
MNLPKNLLLLFLLGIAGRAFALPREKGSDPLGSVPSISSTERTEQDWQWRLEGERRYRANCGRCHQAPHKFPARAMAMAIRHMRVRATLTDDDMKYVLYYITH